MLPSSYPISIFFAALTGRSHRHLTNALLAKYRDTHVARIDIATRRMHYYRKHDLFVQLPCWRSLRITAPTSGQRYNRIICRYRCWYDYTPYPEMNASTRQFIVTSGLVQFQLLSLAGSDRSADIGRGAVPCRRWRSAPFTCFLSKPLAN